MAHHCSALVLACIDFRLIKNTVAWLKEINLEENYDLLTIPGVSKQLVTPDQPADREFILAQIQVSVSLHQVSQVFLIHHEDCGAYGGKAAFKSDADELAKHLADMIAAEKIIKTKYPQLSVVKVYARLNGQFEKI